MYIYIYKSKTDDGVDNVVIAVVKQKMTKEYALAFSSDGMRTWVKKKAFVIVAISVFIWLVGIFGIRYQKTNDWKKKMILNGGTLKRFVCGVRE